MMENPLRTLATVLTLVALAGCGNPEATGETTTGPETDPYEKTAPTFSAENDVSSGSVPDSAAETRLTASDADQPNAAGNSAEFDAKNSTFALEGQTVVLKNGLSQVPAAPGSASSITTRYLGKAARGDLTRDGKEDLAYFITREGGGSGKFFYVVAAIQGSNGYKTTNAFLVGDRIEPQSLRITANELHVNFRGRGRGEPMTTPPSRESVLLLKVTPSGTLEGLMK